eukprot:CAMPEP_0194207998 /NCGR_PEP_ID=MMETSP0156-20130528/6588_1 /TAXON_ID=33649 /ORGANISM="Thalassionema nitzschioides, Strain L26-B" /LENGTH=574 /DNA_ID=CAMNT_0038934883 /DNA_START=69 /DNA_END=1793 /DNA_ORIENTATION=-
MGSLSNEKVDMEETLSKLPEDPTVNGEKTWRTKSCIPSFGDYHKRPSLLMKGGGELSESFHDRMHVSSRMNRKASVTTCAISKASSQRQRITSYLGLGLTGSDDHSFDSVDLFEVSTTRMQRLVMEMEESLKLISCSASSRELEDWACLIYESMSAPSRTFHSVQHIFDISVGADPICKLAIFFHDIVYFSIDGGFNEKQELLIGDVVEVKNADGKQEIRISDKDFDVNTKMVIDIFGFKPGQLLDPFKGLNEFLSAAACVRCYQGNLQAAQLAQIAACIEATIPFRKFTDDGKSPCDILFESLVFVNVEYNLGLQEADLVEAVQRAADLGNRDLENFSTPEKAVFLSNTWNLLPESNINLRNKSVFRISDYAFALKKMTGFFEFLDPDTIYLSFRNSPRTLAVLEKKRNKAFENVKTALIYMYCKSVSIGVVSAISALSGGDAPLALFLGDLPEPHYVSTSIEDFIEAGDPAEGIIVDHCVFNLLKDGRESESNFDIKNSPLAAYLYSLVGDKGVEEMLVHAVYPMDKDNATKLLRLIPEFALANIVAACAEIAITRAERLDQLMVDLMGWKK